MSTETLTWHKSDDGTWVIHGPAEMVKAAAAGTGPVLVYKAPSKVTVNAATLKVNADGTATICKADREPTKAELLAELAALKAAAAPVAPAAPVAVDPGTIGNIDPALLAAALAMAQQQQQQVVTQQKKPSKGKLVNTPNGVAIV